MSLREEKETSSTYGALMDGISTINTFVSLIGDDYTSLPGIDVFLDETKERLARMRRIANAIKPSAGLVAWNRGNHEALRNYRPPQHIPKG